MSLIAKRKIRNSFIYLSLIGLFLAVGIGVYRGGVHLGELTAETVTIQDLPAAITLSFMRMLIAFSGSLLFAFILGLIAARSTWGERIVIPALDILQSIPIVGFFPAAITFFISISSGHRIGVEMAAIFLIFTSMAWNLAFAIYEAIKGAPDELHDAMQSFGVKGSLRFWKFFAPISIPRLVYNSILSWSNGWFFLVACEIIAVGPMRYDLPGIGSFLARAAEHDQIKLVLWGLATLTILILLMDYLIWRPASHWADRFKQGTASLDELEEEEFLQIPKHFLAKILFLRVYIRKIIRILAKPLYFLFKDILLPIFWDLPLLGFQKINISIHKKHALTSSEKWHAVGKKIKHLQKVFVILLLTLIATSSLIFVIYLFRPPWPDIVKQIPLAIFLSTGRLVLALFISFAWILPVVLYCWNRPKLKQNFTTIAQIGASLPATALFPLIIVLATQYFGAGIEIASIVLLLTGMQWYVLFNALGGVATIPNDYQEATRSLGLSKWLTFKKLVLPAMQPALVTGAITAWGGGWNALVVAEYILFKDEVLSVNGIGALINQSVYQSGDTRDILFCIAAMIIWILLINIIFWRPIYKFTSERYRFEG